MNTALVMTQAPMNAGMDAPNQAASGQKHAGQEPLGFKKKLENCIEIDECPYGVPVNVYQTGDNNQDNSMATASLAQQVPSEIVGILEGFGLLDYQSDLLQAPSEGGQAEPSAADKAADILLQGMTQNTEPTGTLEEYARMLSKDQLSRLPQEMQQAILEAVGDYLGSFESTNNKPAPAASAQDAPQAEAPVTKETTAAVTAADTMALPEKIANLLLKIKSVTQSAKPAESTMTDHAAQTVSADATAVNADTEVQAGWVETATKQSHTVAQTDEAVMQTGEPTVRTDEATVQNVNTDKAKPQTAGDMPEQTPKTDAVVHTSAQTQVSSVRETAGAEAKADVQRPAQTTDFVKDNVIRIVDKLSTQVSDGKYDFDVELKPDFLGKVNIKLTMENGELRMQIKTDDINVKSMFADQASTMQAVLKDKGIAVTNIDIAYQSQMQTGDDRQAFRQNNSGGKKQGRQPQVSLEKLAGTGIFEKMTEMTGYTYGGSSVEYLV